MDQPVKPVQGDFTANFLPNAGKSRYGKRRPNIRCNMTVPGTNRELRLSGWTNGYESSAVDGNGVIDENTKLEMLGANGSIETVSRSDSPMDQMRAVTHGKSGPTIYVDRIPGKDPIVLDDGKWVIFQSKHKDGPIALNGERRAEFYGFVNNGGQLIELSLWLHKNKETGFAFLGGSTQFPLPGKEARRSLTEATMSDAELEKRHADFDRRQADERSDDDRSFGYDPR